MSMEDDNRTPDEIEREIESTRSQMSDTINALEQKLSPRRMVSDAFDTISSAISRNGSMDMMQTIKSNPLPFAMIGLGIGWLLYNSSRSGRSHAAPYDPSGGEARYRARENERSYRGRMQSAARAAQDYAGRHLDEAKDYAGRHLGEARDYAERHLGEARDYAGRGYGQARHWVEERPLTIGIVGVVIGGALGALLPVTRHENRYLGDARDELARQAEELGREVVHQARDTAEAAFQAAQREIAGDTTGAAGGAGTQTSSAAPSSAAPPVKGPKTNGNGQGRATGQH